MRKRIIAMVGAIAAIVAVPLSATSANAVGSTGTWAIQSGHVVSGLPYKCLAIGGGSSTAGANAIQFDCEFSADGQINEEQRWKWTLVDNASSTYTIKNVDTGLCLAIGASSHVQGAKAIQWNCDSTNADQQWVYDSSGRLWNKESQLCLAIPNATTTNSVAAIQWKCESVSTAPEQQWIQRPVDAW